MSIAKLRSKRREKVGEIRALLNSVDAESRDLTPEELAKKDALYLEVENIDKRIADEERLEQLAKSSMTEEEREAADVRVIRDERDDEHGKPKNVFRNLGEQLLAVRQAALPNGAVDKRLIASTRAASGLNESVGADGGFLVQTDFATTLMSKAIEAGQISSLVDSLPVAGNGLTINEWQDYDRRDGYQFGGVQAYWDNEADALTGSRPKFSQMEWKLKKLTGLCYATDEMLQDASAMGGIIDSAFRKVFGFKLDQSILFGSGTGQPLGFSKSPCVITQAKESGQAAATIVAENVVKMFARLHASARPDAVWVINQDVEPQLYTMYIPTGTGSGYPLYTPQGGMAGYPYGTLLGRKVITSEHCKTVGSAGDIMLLSPQEYLLITKGGIKQDVSIHVRFLYNEQAFRFVLRVDGAPKWSNVVTPNEGSNTLSPYVELAVRA